jgi:hypothetical protein
MNPFEDIEESLRHFRDVSLREEQATVKCDKDTSILKSHLMTRAEAVYHCSILITDISKLPRARLSPYSSIPGVSCRALWRHNSRFHACRCLKNQ